MFANLSGGPLNYSAWRQGTMERKRAPRLAFPGCASTICARWRRRRMVAAGVDVKTAQRRLGHANVTLTLQVYARATAEADRPGRRTRGGAVPSVG